MESGFEKAALDRLSFDTIAELAYRESGLQLVAEKSSMVQSRLRTRLRKTGLDSFERYARFVCSPEGKFERIQMISALTTNVSHFYREKHHFDILEKEVVAPKLPDIRSGGKLRIWSAGCSNGQEAFTIAISLLKAFPELVKLDFRILATDIDPKVITFANEANYSQKLVNGIPHSTLEQFFDRQEGQEGVHHVAKPALKSVVVFKELNLLHDWPMSREMDAIFCRNVVIYFDSETQSSLWPRFHSQLSENGLLFLGHSERICDPDGVGFVSVGPTTYTPKPRFAP